MGHQITTLDSIAIRLAADSGVAWRDLGDYPGYAKNMWREEAQRLIRRRAPNAIIRGGRTAWDGRSEEWLVIDFDLKAA